jgi:hypothetical protein
MAQSRIIVSVLHSVNHGKSPTLNLLSCWKWIVHSFQIQKPTHLKLHCLLSIGWMAIWSWIAMSGPFSSEESYSTSTSAWWAIEFEFSGPSNFNLVGNSTSAWWAIKLQMSGPFSSEESNPNSTTAWWAIELEFSGSSNFNLIGNSTSNEWAIQFQLGGQWNFKWVGGSAQKKAIQLQLQFDGQLNLSFVGLPTFTL